jgi:DNA recombination protein RmuC
MEILLLIAGLLAGLLGGWVFAQTKIKRREQDAVTREQDLQAQLLRLHSEKDADSRVLSAQLSQVTELKEKAENEIINLRTRMEGLSAELEQTKAKDEYLQNKLEENKAELEKLQQRFTLEFENIANRLLKQHGTEFSEYSQKNINELLNPLKEKLQTFENKVSQAYDQEMREKMSLKAEVKHLIDMNKQMSEEANNLTRALKGDVKKMGNWGEVILERILERSGLEKDTMYQTQVSSTTEEGKRSQPDVIIYLPEKKHIIIDAKVSLVAYERYTMAETEEQRRQFAKEHLQSVYSHVKGLSAKNYQNNDGLNSPDFVLMFIPIEASFSAAFQEDTELFDFAWKSKIVIVSPSTLLATLQTVQSIWKMENQNKNAVEIARQGAALYDKFVGFTEDLLKLGNSLQSTQRFYDEAMGKLQTGKGNLVNRAEGLRKLGLKSTKTLPDKLLANDDIPLLTEESEE